MSIVQAAARRSSAARTARGVATRPVEELERRTMLSVSPVDPTFAALEPDVPSEASGVDVAVRGDGKVLVAGTRRLGDVWRMAVTRYHVDGSPDTTFGTGGYVFPDFGTGRETATSMALAPDGRIVVAGGSGGDYAVARLNPDGTPDASFGGDGKITVDLGGAAERVRDVQVDAAGRVVAAGADGAGALRLLRFTAAGASDPSFGGGDGVAETALTAPGFTGVAALLTLPDNRIVLAGGTNSALRVTRFREDGSAETHFTAGIAGDAYDLALQPDGKVVVAGIGSRYRLARFTTAGVLDPTFGTGGVVTTTLGAGGEYAAAVAVRPDGRIVATGVAFPQGGGYDYYTARYLPDGTLDTSFGGDGVVSTEFRLNSVDFARAVAIAPGGKVVVAGDVTDLYADVQTAGVARLNADGSLDTSFGGTGKVLAPVEGHSRTVNAVARQPDGKVVVAGTQQTGFRFDFFVARYGADGRRDASFGDGGVTVTDFGGRSDDANALLIQPDGKIVVGGDSNAPEADRRFALARYTADGRLDPGFDGDGRVLTEMGTHYDEGVKDLDLYPGGRVVATGHGGIARYRADGSPDPTFVADGTLNQPDAWLVAGAVQGDKILYSDGNAVRRVNADGSSDPSFGFVRLPVPPNRYTYEDEEPYTTITELEVAADGRFFLGGTYHANDYDDIRTAFVVQRYLPSGAPDTSFGSGGQTLSDFPEFAGEAVTGMAVGPDGKPVLAGTGQLEGHSYVPLVARYTADGRLDGAFGFGGRAYTDDYSFAAGVAVQPDGKVLLGMNGGDGAAVLRFRGAGRAGAVLDRSRHSVVVNGSPGSDTIRIDGTSGRLTVYLNGRRQTFANRTFDRVLVYAGDGADRVTINGRVYAQVYAGGGDDRVLGGSDSDQIYGDEGDDTIDGGLGNDGLSGGDGIDTVDYGTRMSPVYLDRGGLESGEAGEADRIDYDVEVARGGGGNDTIGRFPVAYGNAGDDSLYGAESGRSALWGGDGDDVLSGFSGADYFRGGDGTDTVSYGGRGDGVTVTIDGVADDGAAGEGDNVFTDVENVVGGDGDDRITGSDADNVIRGGGGNDDLRGGAGNDTLTGDAGRDQLRGQAGDDTLFARGDGAPDFLDGGSGTDAARKDEDDFAQYVEQLLA